MAAYLHAYACHHGVHDRILFRAEVTHIRPLQTSDPRGRWLVEREDGTEAAFDTVLVCTGPFSRARELGPLKDAFSGEYLHSSEYRGPARFLGKRVCVIGAGNSAVDIASDICHHALRTVLAARSGVVIVPHFVLGMSVNQLSVRYLQRPWVPDLVRRALIGLLVRVVHGRVTQHGFKAPTHRVHPTISSTIVQDIFFNRVSVKQGISRIEGRTIEFIDGQREEFDTILSATGFHTEFPFLPAQIASSGNQLELYKRMIAPGFDGLYFVGIINLDTPINYVCERQARWIAAFECGEAILPDADTMRRDIARKHAWVLRNYGASERHSKQEESKRYFRELAQELRRGRRRVEKL
jgi:cation diffusion facilitator CzcD-associated flavoprotein CzcO